MPLPLCLTSMTATQQAELPVEVLRSLLMADMMVLVREYLIHRNDGTDQLLFTLDGCVLSCEEGSSNTDSLSIIHHTTSP